MVDRNPLTIRGGSISVLGMALLLIGCTSMVKHPGYGTWDESAEELGPVSVCRGGNCQGTDEGSQWPLSLTHPPDAHTYHSALIEKAAKLYNVPEKEIVLDEVDVQIYAEVVGTVRGWKATSVAARRVAVERPGPADSDPPSVEKRLRELRDLRDEGLLTEEEYDAKRGEIIGEL